MGNHYDSLQLNRDASTEEIGKAFRRATLEFHPDRNKSEDAKAFFIAAQLAHQVLSNAESRAAYDQSLLTPAAGPEEQNLSFFSGEPEAGNPFSNPSSAGPQSSAEPQLVQLDIYDSIDISLKELFNGSTRWLEVLRKIRCTDPTCSTEGCQHCRGRRFIESKKRLKIEISAYYEPPLEYRFSGEGDEAIDGRRPPGDVVIRTRILPHALYRRQGVNLFYEKQITAQELLCGCIFELPPLDRRDWRFSLLDQVPNFEAHYAARGYGMLKGQGLQRGCLIVKFFLRTPRRLISLREDWISSWVEINRDSEENPTMPLDLLTSAEFFHITETA